MKLVIATTALLLAGTATLAETSQTGSDWAGTYAGATYATASGENDYYGDGSSSDIFPLEGTAFGGFVGYRQNVGALVVGGEASFLSGPDIFETGYEGDYFYENVIDLKLTAGYSISSALAYASVGYATSTFDGGGTIDTINGWLVGVGVDVMLTDSFFVGAEYVYRDMRNDDFWETDDGLNGQLSTLQVRGGFRF